VQPQHLVHLPLDDEPRCFLDEDHLQGISKSSPLRKDDFRSLWWTR
jgi:hypothetical protein